MPLVAYQLPPSGIPVGRIVRRVLLSKGLSQKEAAIIGGCREATLSAGLADLGPLPLQAVMCWPLPVVFRIFRALIVAKLKRWEDECCEERKIS